MRGITKAFPGVRRQRGRRLRGRAGRGPRASRRERRRQDDADEHPHRALPAGRRARSHVHGEPVEFHTPRDALAAGIGMVHQHFRLVEALTVAENLMLGWHTPRLLARSREPGRRRCGSSSEALQHARRPGRPHLAALGRRAAAGRDRQGASFASSRDAHPRRADRRAHPAGGRRSSSRRCGTWPPKGMRSSSSRTSCTR